MVKSIIKEIFIMLLLCIAIVLILGVLFYDYIPSNRVIPVKEAYETPNDVLEEVKKQITEIEKTEISYEITDADLNLYKQTSDYKPGKPDPFAEITDSSTVQNSATVDDNNTSNNNTDTDTNTDKNTSSNANSTETFFNDELGIK